MKGKIMILALLCALLVGLVPPNSARADEEEVKRYENVDDYISQLGVNMPKVSPVDGKSYVLTYNNGYYLFVFERELGYSIYSYYKTGYGYNCDVLYSDGTPCWTVMDLPSGLTDYSDASWRVLNSDYFNKYPPMGYGQILYSDVNIYSDGNFSDVLFASNKDLPNFPSIPNALKEQAETLVAGRFSLMAKKKANCPFIIVSSGVPVLRTSDRAVAFMKSDGSFVADAEVWLVDETTGEWYMTESGISAYGGNDKTGYGVEYAPLITYTNQDIYLQDDNLEGVVPSSVVWKYASDYVEKPIEIVADGFPRLFDSVDALTYLYSEKDASGLPLLALYKGSGGVVTAYEYDEVLGVSWYKVSVYFGGELFEGYVLAKAIEVGHSVLSGGGGESPTPTPTPAVGGGSGDFMITYKPALSGEVVADSLYMRKEASVNSEAVSAFIKTWSLTLHGYVQNAEGVWYFCSAERDGQVYTGYVLSEYVKIVSGSGGSGDGSTLDETLAQALAELESLALFVARVPMVIGIIFSFMPAWCLGLVGIAFIFLVLGAIKGK